MKSTFPWIAALALAGSVPALAADEVGFEPDEVLPTEGDDVEVYRKAFDWMVYKNNSRQSCFIEKHDEGSGVIQAGLTLNQEYGYIGAFMKGVEVEEGNHELVLVVNDEIYSGTSSNVKVLKNGYQGGYILINNKQFAKDLKHAKEMVAYPDQPYRLIMDTKHAGPAMYEARECMKEFDGDS